MSIDATEVRVAGAGHVYAAPEGTTPPTDVKTALPAAWIDLGYCTEDGVAFSFGRETTDLNAWQGDKIRVLTTAEPATVGFTLMQTNSDVLPVAFGGGTIAKTGTAPDEVYTFTPPAKGTNTVRSLCIEFNDGTIVYRYTIARAQIEGNVEFTLTRTGAVQYPLSFGILDNGTNPKWSLVTNDEALATA